MCSKDQLMNIPFLFTVLPEAVARFSATCVSCLPKSCLDWVCPALNHIPHPAGQDLHLDQPWPIRPLAEVWNDTSVTSSATYLPNVQRYVTASRWSLPCSTPQTRTQGALKSSSSSIFTPPPRTVRHNFSPLYPQPLSLLSLWSNSSGPLQLPLPDLSSLPASLPLLIWSSFSLLKSPSLFTHTYNDKLTFFLMARVLFYNLAIPLSSLTLAAASKLPQSWYSFQTRAASWNIPRSFILSCLPTGCSLCPESPVSSLAIWKLCFTFQDPHEASVPQKVIRT